MVSKKTFSVGDFVFAKVKGYPPWPAKVTNAEKGKKYSVWFYGTGETAKCKAEELYKYQDTKKSHANEKARTKKGFKDAYEQIERAIANTDDDVCPINQFDETTENSTNDVKEEKEDETLELDETVEASFNASRVSANSTLADQSAFEGSEVVSKNDESVAAAEEPVEEEEEAEIKEPPVVSKEIKNEVKVDLKVEQVKEEKETPKENEPKSRSGRTIKVKRYEDAATDEELLLVQPGMKRRAVLSEDRSPNKKFKKEVKKPEVKTEKTVEKEVVEQNPVIDRKTLWNLETTLVELNLAIKSSVGLTNADAEKCVGLLEDLQKLRMTKLMLKKNPNCVETIKRLRKYIGNTKNWNMDPEKEQTFKGYAKDIRAKATEIYDGFKAMFVAPEDLPFWQFFSEEVRRFEFATRNMPKEDVYHLVDEKDVPVIDLEAMKEAQLQAIETPDSSEPGEPTVESKQTEENIEEMEVIQEEENEKEEAGEIEDNTAEEDDTENVA